MEESFYFFPKPLWKLWEGAEWKEASLHRLRSILGRTPDLQGTRGLISWSGNTIAYTCNDDGELYVTCCFPCLK